MARTRGAKTSSPSSRKPAPHEAPIQASPSEPPRPEVAPPPVKATPKKRQSPVPSPEPSPVPSPAPPAKPQASQPPPSEPQIPSETAPEVILRRPMLTQPPIEEPQLERKRICRDVFTFDKWSNMTAYRMEQLELPQPAQMLAARRASPRLTPEGIPIAFPSIARAPPVPPVTPASAQPSTSDEPRMAIPISEYRDLCQLQHHLGLPAADEHLTPTTAIPHSQATEPQAPHEPVTEEVEPSA
ncbi:vegetative cell wall protein gp1-like [Vitis riparia]|uniref:vegetative cell wall protein gp1-like n=1 Tax=Vitis riparia TaxID=96939 RepID=UPI00155B3E42|nr:vegetative cell wall protein gp1-like [Vitis riparia]